MLTYTGAALREPLQLAGPVTAQLHVHPDQVHADVFVRLCDVAPDGQSTNICDALVRLPSQGSREQSGAARVVELDLGATVYQLAAAHRLRVLVAGGAHPRWVRNYGTGESWPTATRLVPVHHAVHHSPQRPSVIALPVAPALLAGDPAGR